jgi:hypothetical protein
MLTAARKNVEENMRFYNENWVIFVFVVSVINLKSLISVYGIADIAAGPEGRGSQVRTFKLEGKSNIRITPTTKYVSLAVLPHLIGGEL